MTELDLQALADGYPPGDMDAAECIVYLAKRVLAADKLVNTAKTILDGYGFVADGNDAWREVETSHIEEMEESVIEYRATK